MNPHEVVRNLFVGRKAEIARIRETLREEGNILLEGRFGMGRTSLLRHMERQVSPGLSWVFLDGADTPAVWGRNLVERLCPRGLNSSGGDRISAREDRHHLEHVAAQGKRPAVIVLDHLGKLTHPKAAFCRWLAGLRRFRIIAVPDASVPRQSLEGLRMALYPCLRLQVGHLSPAATRRFFETFADRQGLSWTPGHIHGLAFATRGYPLAMWQALRGVHTGADSILPIETTDHADRREVP